MILFCLAIIADSPTPPSRPIEAAASRPAEAKPGTDLSFDLLPPSALVDPAKAAKIEKQMKLRRTLLTIHLINGYALLAALGVTEVLGALDFYDRFGGGGYTNRYNDWHEAFAVASTVIFAGQAGLAIAAPNPFPKAAGLTASTFHRIFEYTAAAGMATEIVTGPVSAAMAGKISERDWAVAHLLIGSITYALVIAGYLAWFFA